MRHAQARRSAHAADIEQDNPFARLAGGASERAISLADTVRRCRWISVDLGARDFALCLAGPSADSSRLTPCFDSHYPSAMPATRMLGGGIGEHLMRHISQSTAPCWWADDAGAETDFATLLWARRLEPQARSGRGIALPVYTERGQAGIFIFGGPELAPNGQSLHDLHGRCFALFDAVTRIGPEFADKLPVMSRREIECLRLTSRGHTSEDIARLLKLSVHTANQYLTQTSQKLDAVNRMHAVAKALRLGLID